MSAHVCSILPQEKVQVAFSNQELKNGLLISSRGASDCMRHWLTVYLFNHFFKYEIILM